MRWVGAFRHGWNRTDLIKRVIAGGRWPDRVLLRRQKWLLVDGRSFDEPYINYEPEFGPAGRSGFGPVRVARRTAVDDG